MLKKAGALLGLGFFLAVTHFAAHAQQAADSASPAADSSTPVVDDTSQLGPVYPPPTSVADWGVDPVTFEVVGPPDAEDALVMLNSPDQVEVRRLALLQLLNPDEYYRQFPKTPEQMQAEADAIYVATHPLTVAELRARQTPEKNAADDAELAKILTPTIPVDPGPPPPGPAANATVIAPVAVDASADASVAAPAAPAQN